MFVDLFPMFLFVFDFCMFACIVLIGALISLLPLIVSNVLIDFFGFGIFVCLTLHFYFLADPLIRLLICPYSFVFCFVMCLLACVSTCLYV